MAAQALAFGAFEPAMIAATISILLGGILFGVGLGFQARRIRLLGMEELGQGIISAAMVGALAAFCLLLNSAAASLLPAETPECPAVPSPASSPYSYYECGLSSLEGGFSGLSFALARSAEITGFASSLKVSAGVITAQPFFALEDASRQLSSSSALSQSASSLAFFERSIADFVRTSALLVFLPAGLLLRCFFATRRLGAAAMALSISAYIIYPLIFLYSIPQSGTAEAATQAAGASASFNEKFAAIPLLDLDETASVKEKIGEMSQNDFSGQLQPLFSLSSRALSLSATDLILLPLLSLIVSGVAALELYRLLSAQIFLPYFESI